MIYKTCISCNESKPRRIMFTSNRSRPDGHSDVCRACQHDIRSKIKPPMFIRYERRTVPELEHVWYSAARYTLAKSIIGTAKVVNHG